MAPVFAAIVKKVTPVVGLEGVVMTLGPVQETPREAAEEAVRLVSLDPRVITGEEQVSILRGLEVQPLDKGKSYTIWGTGGRVETVS